MCKSIIFLLFYIYLFIIVLAIWIINVPTSDFKYTFKTVKKLCCGVRTKIVLTKNGTLINGTVKWYRYCQKSALSNNGMGTIYKMVLSQMMNFRKSPSKFLWHRYLIYSINSRRINMSIQHNYDFQDYSDTIVFFFTVP